MIKKLKLITLLLSAMILVLACTPKQSRRVEKSGFLGDYSEFKEGKSNEALYLYINPKADCNNYTKVIIDPVSLWVKTDDSDLAKLEDKDEKMLLTLAWKTLHDAMKDGEFEVVEQAGPGVLRVRGALTEAVKARVMVANVLAVVPFVWIGTTVWGIGTGKWPYLGELSGEMEILDSETGERMLAGVDKVVGRLGGNLDPRARWGDVIDGFQLWRDRIGVRMKSCRVTGSFAMPEDDRMWINKTIDYVSP